MDYCGINTSSPFPVVFRVVYSQGSYESYLPYSCAIFFPLNVSTIIIISLLNIFTFVFYFFLESPASELRLRAWQKSRVCSFYYRNAVECTAFFYLFT
jgi:hypothetical protein